jgi:hypothetical protein
MPLRYDSSDRSRSKNIRQMIHDGLPRNQAVAAAYRIQRESKRRRNPVQAPTSQIGNIAAAVAVLTAGTAAGAVIGSAISPAAPPGNKTVGALEGAGLGILVTSFSALVAGRLSPKWKRVADLTGLMGAGVVTGMALLGAAAMKPAPAALPAAPPLPAIATQLTPGGVYELVGPIPAGATTDTAAGLTAAGWTSVQVHSTPSPGMILALKSQGATFPSSGAYDATGTYSGGAGPVPAGVVALQTA